MRIIKRILVVLGIATVSLVVAGTPAHALTCNWSAIPWNTGGSTWGAAKFCGGSTTWQIQSDDRQTDGYCVHGEAYDYMPWGVYAWEYIPNSESCGAVRTSSQESGAAKEIRLVRGDTTHCIRDGTCNGIGVNYFTIIRFNLS
jgi:hypothetical protein